MLEEFLDKFPKSNLRSEARFYLGVAQARARKYERAIDALGKFFDESPKKSLEPYAYLERSRALYSLERYAEAAGRRGHGREQVQEERARDTRPARARGRAVRAEVLRQGARGLSLSSARIR
jgi:tetratricopeptide (TPR) repeat protein